LTRSTFWMVLGYGTPMKRHESEEAAMKEAARLAMNNPGHEFNVLRSVGTVTKRETIFEPHEPVDPPF
jgi:hypothetical protein